jgi:hypothetical protein
MSGEHYSGALASVEDRNEELIQAEKRGYERGRREAFKHISLRLGLIASVSSMHSNHVCPQDDCMECWPGDIIDELKGVARAAEEGS